MSLTFKLLSLAVRTAAKPIGNYIKRQAKEHDGFRRFAINQAQRVHRIDMRMRLGILHDPEAQQRMHEREMRAAEEKKKQAEAPTVRTAEDQRRHDEQKAQEEKSGKEGKKKEDKPTRVKIRPLSDTRAIELGANFFSEAFIFGVAVALLLLENYRSRNKESNRRDEIAERLADLEAQVQTLRDQHDLPELEALNERIKRKELPTSWWNPAGWLKRNEPSQSDEVGDSPLQESKAPSDAQMTGIVPANSSVQASKGDQSTRSDQQEEVKGNLVTQPARLNEVKGASKGR